MIVYTYDEQTKKETGTHICQKCPESKEWLYPQFYRKDEPQNIPSEIKNKSNFYINKKWKIKDDFKNAKTWNKKTGEVKINTEFELEKGYTEKEKPSEYHVFKKDDWGIDEKLKKEVEKINNNNKIKAELLQTDIEISRSLENVIDVLIKDGNKFDKKITDLVKKKKELRKKIKV